MWLISLAFGSVVIGTILAAMFPGQLPDGGRPSPLPRVLRFSLLVAVTIILLYALVGLAAVCSG